MVVITDFSIVDELTGGELKMLLKLTKVIVVDGDPPPTNQELADMLGIGITLARQQKKALKDKGMILIRPIAGKPSDYKIITNKIGGFVGAAEGQRRVEQKESIPEPAQPTASAEPKADDLHPLEPVEVSKAEGYKTMLLTDTDFIARCAMKHRIATNRVRELINDFTEDKITLGLDNWSAFSKYKSNFFYWLTKQDLLNGTREHKEGKQSDGLHANGQVLDEAGASRVLASLSRDS